MQKDINAERSTENMKMDEKAEYIVINGEAKKARNSSCIHNN